MSFWRKREREREGREKERNYIITSICKDIFPLYNVQKLAYLGTNIFANII